MKIALTFLCCCSFAFATPSKHVYSKDTFLGQSETHYAILRTVFDNKGSYYESSEFTYLVEFSKETGKEVKKTFIAEVMEDRDVDTWKVTRSPGRVNKEFLFSKVVQEYTLGEKSETKRWARRIEVSAKGIYLDKKHVLLSDEELSLLGIEVVEGEDAPELPKVTLFEVRGELYLKKEQTNEVDDDAADDLVIVHIAKERARPILQREVMHTVYLSIGSFKTKKEAADKAKAVAKASLKNDYFLGLTIWKREHDKLPYVLVLNNSQGIIKNEHVAKATESFAEIIEPIFSTTFIESWKADFE